MAQELSIGFVVTIVLIMVASGVLGGLINCFISDPSSEAPLSWWKHVVVGIGAAFMVPVFLNMISSKLIENISGTVLSAVMLQNLLILAGFCLLAAISSRAFIRSLTERILREVSAAKREARQANEKATNAEAIAELDKNEPETAKVAEDEAELEPGESFVSSQQLSDSQKKVLAALGNSKYSMRTRHGIAGDTGLTYGEVVNEVPHLEERGLVVSLRNSRQQPRWALSEEGRRVLKFLPSQLLNPAQE